MFWRKPKVNESVRKNASFEVRSGARLAFQRQLSYFQPAQKPLKIGLEATSGQGTVICACPESGIVMPKNLVIVESPAKAKTINKYLGKDFVVKASIGHIKDLPSKGLGVDVQNNFEPEYEIIPDSKKRNNKKIVADLKKTAKEVEAIYLAADPDREGEAFCQHLAEEIVP